jgi:hypothetical protein
MRIMVFKHYYVNDKRQPEVSNRNNEVHAEGCYWLTLVASKTYLGYFWSCAPAVAEARKKYPFTADGCIHCCPDCHRG